MGPPQLLYGAWHWYWQLPPTQRRSAFDGDAQVAPGQLMPQWSGSFARSKQLAGMQNVFGGLQLVLHTPVPLLMSQKGVVLPQALPHALQF
jgi:hypothetical protein